ncbi:MAG: ABC transporter ATP-binding protein [Planctomycetota bacterium]
MNETPQDSPLLVVKNIDVFYGGIHAIKDVSLSVPRGKLTTLIGANGAGKTTTLKAICGLQPPRNGSVLFDGQDITGSPPHRCVENGLVLCPEGRRIFPDLTVDDNLALGAYTRRDNEVASDMKRMRDMFPILKERASQSAGTLSGGEQQMLALARALMSRPKLLMLDEPSLGLAPLVVDRIFQILKDLKSQRMTILLVEQNAQQALEIADNAYVLETGRVVNQGDPKKLLTDDTVMKAYLGG